MMGSTQDLMDTLETLVNDSVIQLMFFDDMMILRYDVSLSNSIDRGR